MGWFAHFLLRGRGGRETRRKPDEAAPRAVLSRPPTDSLSRVPSPTVSSPADRRLSQDADLAGKVIVHLGMLGRLGNDEVGRPGYTQAGISEALGIRQGTLTKVLSRLEAALVVEVDRRHVQGQSRRLNVYRLTALGESVAKDLRHRSPGATSNAVKPPTVRI